MCLPMQEMQETQVWNLGQEDPIEEEMETHPSILAWEHPIVRGAWQVTESDMTEQLSLH